MGWNHISMKFILSEFPKGDLENAKFWSEYWVAFVILFGMFYHLGQMVYPVQFFQTFF